MCRSFPVRNSAPVFQARPAPDPETCRKKPRGVVNGGRHSEVGLVGDPFLSLPRGPEGGGSARWWEREAVPARPHAPQLLRLGLRGPEAGRGECLAWALGGLLRGGREWLRMRRMGRLGSWMGARSWWRAMARPGATSGEVLSCSHGKRHGHGRVVPGSWASGCAEREARQGVGAPGQPAGAGRRYRCVGSGGLASDLACPTLGTPRRARCQRVDSVSPLLAWAGADCGQDGAHRSRGPSGGYGSTSGRDKARG